MDTTLANNTPTSPPSPTNVTPAFWDTEDVTLFQRASQQDDLVDDSLYFISMEFDWIPARVENLPKDGQCCQAIGLDGTSYNVTADEIVEKIEGIEQIARLPDDLVQLQSTSEILIVYTLKERFLKGDIYTSIGNILIAINPFRLLPLYTPLVLQHYLDISNTSLKPHPFGVSRHAYLSLKSSRKNQSILISGESGAGKTETTKLCLSFLSEISQSPTDIEEKILSANPLLEAFGNAKTLRNNNSSRFGKFIELNFNSTGKVIGCGTTTYLLEKSRVHKQAQQERSYHIFYQLCGAFVDAKDRKMRGNSSFLSSQSHRKSLWDLDADSIRQKRVDLSPLSLATPETFTYLFQSSCYTIPSINDVESFYETELSAIKLGISRPELYDIFSLCACILHLGNIEFLSDHQASADCCITSDDDVSKNGLENASRLLGCESGDLSYKLRHREFVLRNETNVVSLSASQAVDARDALCKSLYRHSFDWLVKKTNQAMSSKQAVESFAYSIGVLDIFGFEIFELNGFEQLCINYANEKLQQHFNYYTFKREMEACIKENVPCDKITFVDNQDVLDLIDKKGNTSIISILDDEVKLPRATNLTFLNKLKEKHSNQAAGSSTRFLLAKGSSSQNSFGIDHFAGK